MSKDTGKRAKKDNTIVGLFAKQAQTANPVSPDKPPGGANTVDTPTQGVDTPPISVAVEGNLPEVPPAAAAEVPPNEKLARQQEGDEDTEKTRKRKEPPNDLSRLQVEEPTQDEEDAKPAAEEDFVLPPGANLKAPANLQDMDGLAQGLTFQQMWEEVLAKAPDERAKTWATATAEFNKAIICGEAHTIRQTIATWRTQSYGTNFAVIYRTADSTIQVLHALDAVQAGVLGLQGGIPNTQDVKVVAIPVEKWGMTEMYPASPSQARQEPTTTFKKGDRKTPVPNVRALTPDQLEMMLGDCKTAGEWYRILEAKHTTTGQTSRTDSQLMQYLRAAATKAPTPDHPLTMEMDEIGAEMEIAQTYKATAYQRFYGRAMDGASISTRSAATAFEQWNIVTGGVPQSLQPPGIMATIPRNQPPQQMGPPDRVQYATPHQTPPVQQHQTGTKSTGEAYTAPNPFQPQQPGTKSTGEATTAPNPHHNPMPTGAVPNNNPMPTGPTTNPMLTGAPTINPTITGATTNPANTGPTTTPTNRGAPTGTRLTTQAGTAVTPNTSPPMGAPTAQQTTTMGAPYGQMVQYTTPPPPPPAPTHTTQPPTQTMAHQGNQLATLPPTYQNPHHPTPQMQLGFGQNPFQPQQQLQHHGILQAPTPPVQHHQLAPQTQPTMPGITQMYAILNKHISTGMTEADWQRIDQLRTFPGLAHLPLRPQQQNQVGFQLPHVHQAGGLYAQQQPKGLPEDDIARLCAISNLQPNETSLLNPIWNRVAKGTTKARKKQLVRNWWTGLRASQPVLPAEPTPDIFNAIIDMNFASDVQAPKANGLYPAMLLSVSASENYEQNLLLHNQDRATFITADDLAKQTGRDFSRLKFTHMKVKDAFQCFWIILLNLFGNRCTMGRQAWQIWNELRGQHRYDENYERYTQHIGPQLLSASLLKFRDQFGICPSNEEFQQGYTAPHVDISDLISRIRNGQDFRDYDVLERWFPRPKPKHQPQNNPPQNPGQRTPQPPPDRRGNDRRPNLPPPPPPGMAPPERHPTVENPNHFQQLRTYVASYLGRHRRKPRIQQLCNAAGISQNDITGHMGLQPNDCKRFHIVGSCNCGGTLSHGALSTQVQNAVYTKIRSGLERLMADPVRYMNERYQPTPPAART